MTVLLCEFSELEGPAIVWSSELKNNEELRRIVPELVNLFQSFEAGNLKVIDENLFGTLEMGTTQVEIIPLATNSQYMALAVLFTMVDPQSRGFTRSLTLARVHFKNNVVLKENEFRLDRYKEAVRLVQCGNLIDLLEDLIPQILQPVTGSRDLFSDLFKSAFVKLEHYFTTYAFDVDLKQLVEVAITKFKPFYDFLRQTESLNDNVITEMKTLIESLNIKLRVLYKRNLDDPLRNVESLAPQPFFSEFLNMVMECETSNLGAQPNNLEISNSISSKPLLKFSFAKHIIFALLIDRKIVIKGLPSHETIIEELIEELAIFAPWEVKRSNFTSSLDEYRNCNIIGVPLNFKTDKDVVVLDLKNEAYFGPIYDSNRIVSTVLDVYKICSRKSFKSFLTSFYLDLKFKAKSFNSLSPKDIPHNYQQDDKYDRYKTINSLGFSFRKKSRRYSNTPRSAMDLFTSVKDDQTYTSPECSISSSPTLRKETPIELLSFSDFGAHFKGNCGITKSFSDNLLCSAAMPVVDSSTASGIFSQKNCEPTAKSKFLKMFSMTMNKKKETEIDAQFEDYVNNFWRVMNIDNKADILIIETFAEKLKLGLI